ncbi:MAG: tRNA (guanosine(37)-N1)-methyltransferase TrmD [Anaerolineales bacterium]|jgi:tRNA (guanine37-N1)-methyltransferase
MRFDVFTILPDMMQGYLQASIMGKAQEAGHVSVAVHDIRAYAIDRHHTTDDEPYGGGGGMIMKPEPVFAAVESVLGQDLNETPVVLLTPQGRIFDQSAARRFASQPRLALICGRYEGFDERIRQYLATDEISIGDYVLTGGELPALVVIDAVTRLLPGVLGDKEATSKDSHWEGLLEHPHYTRPAEFRGWEVPEVLRSGDHGRIAAWRRQQSLLRTVQRRPDLLPKADLDPQELAQLGKLDQEPDPGSKPSIPGGEDHDDVP